MPRHRRNDDRPAFGHEQEAEALGAKPEATDNFDFDPATNQGPLGMALPDRPDLAFKWVSFTNPDNGQDDPREVMKHLGPALGKWTFVRPEEFPDFMPLKMTHASFGSCITTQGMVLMCVPKARRDKLVAYFDSVSDRQVEDIQESASPSNQDARASFALTKLSVSDGRMRQPTIRE